MTAALPETPLVVVIGDELVLPCLYRSASGTGIDLTGGQIVGSLSWFEDSIPISVAEGNVIMGDNDSPSAWGRFTIAIPEIDTLRIPKGQNSKLSIKFIDSLSVTTTLVIWRCDARVP